MSVLKNSQFIQVRRSFVKHVPFAEEYNNWRTDDADQKLVSHFQCTSLYIWSILFHMLCVWEWATQLFDGVCLSANAKQCDFLTIAVCNPARCRVWTYDGHFQPCSQFWAVGWDGKLSHPVSNSESRRLSLEASKSELRCKSYEWSKWRLLIFFKPSRRRDRLCWLLNLEWCPYFERTIQSHRNTHSFGVRY